ncbi:cytochrome c [Candidatus Pelagibacter sp.]|nr:cytochrome c [Candidatus Pelagibacter sp.]
MHYLIKHIEMYIGISLFVIFLILSYTNANSEQSAESIIKERKALFSKNYKTAKKVQSLSTSGDFDEAKELMIEMSKNYEVLLGLFPENSKEGFKTGSLPIIWEEKDSFNALMQKSSDDMVKLTSVIETTDDVRGTIGKLMWGNCKACHSKYREEH